MVQTGWENSYIGGNRVEEVKRNYENFKMALVGTMNMGLETLDRMLSKAIAENQSKDKKIQELESRIKELEQK